MSTELVDLIHVTQHLTGGNHEDFELWIGRYAELLGCQPRAGAVAVAIESLVEATSIDQSEELRSAKRMIANLRSKLNEI